MNKFKHVWCLVIASLALVLASVGGAVSVVGADDGTVAAGSSFAQLAQGVSTDGSSSSGSIWNQISGLHW